MDAILLGPGPVRDARAAARDAGAASAGEPAAAGLGERGGGASGAVHRGALVRRRSVAMGRRRRADKRAAVRCDAARDSVRLAHDAAVRARDCARLRGPEPVGPRQAAADDDRRVRPADPGALGEPWRRGAARRCIAVAPRERGSNRRPRGDCVRHRRGAVDVRGAHAHDDGADASGCLDRWVAAAHRERGNDDRAPGHRARSRDRGDRCGHRRGQTIGESRSDRSRRMCRGDRRRQRACRRSSSRLHAPPEQTQSRFWPPRRSPPWSAPCTAFHHLRGCRAGWTPTWGG